MAEKTKPRKRPKPSSVSVADPLKVAQKPKDREARRRVNRATSAIEAAVHAWQDLAPDERVTVSAHKYLADFARMEMQSGAPLFAEVLAAIAERSLQGDPQAAKLFFDRTLGPVKAEVDITSGGKSLEPQVVIYLPDNGRDNPDQAPAGAADEVSID